MIVLPDDRICPRCDGQGLLELIRINLTGELVILCDECDALWTENMEVSVATFHDFGTYIAPLGIKGLWSDVTVLESND